MRVCPKCHLRYADEVERCLIDHTALAEASDPRIGTVLLGRYKIESRLGSGGMASVYRASHALVDRPVAIKILHDRFAQDEGLRVRLEREARATAAVAHPNIVEIYDFGRTDDGVPFLVMELLRGETLRQRMRRGRLTVQETVALGLQLVRGLARAHDLGVIHRDVKPDNIFLCKSDDGEPVVKLVDFGIALAPDDHRLTASGQIIGSPEYMSPEQLRYRDVSPAADLYALGCVLFEMVTGRLPFQSNNMAGFVIAHMQDAPPSPLSLEPTCPRDLDALILQLMAKSPEGRPGDAHVVLAALDALAPENARRIRKASTMTSSSRRSAVFEKDPAELWRHRVITFDEMLERSWPGGTAPRELTETVAELRASVGRLASLRKRGVEAEARLERMESELRGARERLGHAVHVTAADLSQARAHQGFQTTSPGSQAAFSLQAFQEAWNSARAHVGPSPSHPTDDGLLALRAAAEAYGHWLDAFRPEVVRDLEFQLQTLRTQLQEIEEAAARDHAQIEAQLAAEGDERTALENRLLQMSMHLYGRLRSRPGLQDLFRQLDGVGA